MPGAMIGVAMGGGLGRIREYSAKKLKKGSSVQKAKLDLEASSRAAREELRVAGRPHDGSTESDPPMSRR